MSFPNVSSDQQSTALPPLLSEAFCEPGYDTPFQGPAMGRPILGASNQGCFSFLYFLVDSYLLV